MSSNSRAALHCKISDLPRHGYLKMYSQLSLSSGADYGSVSESLAFLRKNLVLVGEDFSFLGEDLVVVSESFALGFQFLVLVCEDLAFMS